VIAFVVARLGVCRREIVFVWDVGKRKGWLDFDLMLYATELARVMEAVMIIL
jgi:hypothetical protein